MTGSDSVPRKPGSIIWTWDIAGHHRVIRPLTRRCVSATEAWWRPQTNRSSIFRQHMEAVVEEEENSGEMFWGWSYWTS